MNGSARVYGVGKGLPILNLCGLASPITNHQSSSLHITIISRASGAKGSLACLDCGWNLWRTCQNFACF